MKLDGKRALVTGGSSGIGFAVAKSLLAKGAKVAITGRRASVVSSAVEELRKGGGAVTGIAADVGTAEGRAETLRGALDALGGSISWSTTPVVSAPEGWRSRRRRRSRRC